MRKLLLGMTLALPIAFAISPASAFSAAPSHPLLQSSPRSVDLIEPAKRGPGALVLTGNNTFTVGPNASISGLELALAAA